MPQLIEKKKSDLQISLQKLIHLRISIRVVNNVDKRSDTKDTGRGETIARGIQEDVVLVQKALKRRYFNLKKKKEKEEK